LRTWQFYSEVQYQEHQDNTELQGLCRRGAEKVLPAPAEALYP